jgi:branched-chain amino acid transport system ATP-binding protein
MTSALQLINVGRSFGGIRALHNVSFDVPAGVIMGVIGPNGAGKTTLFNCIAGAMPPSYGRIVFEDHDIHGLHPHQICKRGLARTFQIVRPFRGMTVLDNVKVGAFARHATVHAAESCALGVLDLLGLRRIADTDAESISISDMRRMEIARALATEPRFLLLDEMLAGLTPTEAAEMCEQVRALRSRGITILMVEHSVPIVRSLCDEAVVLNFGELLVRGSVDQVFEDPLVQDAYLGNLA